MSRANVGQGVGRYREHNRKRVQELYAKKIPPTIIAQRLGMSLTTVKRILGLVGVPQKQAVNFWKDHV